MHVLCLWSVEVQANSLSQLALVDLEQPQYSLQEVGYCQHNPGQQVFSRIPSALAWLECEAVTTGAGSSEGVIKNDDEEKRRQRISFKKTSVNFECVCFSFWGEHNSVGIFIHNLNIINDAWWDSVSSEDFKHSITINGVESVTKVNESNDCFLVMIFQLLNYTPECQQVG